MYSGDVFNAHLLLRYGYTKDLFDFFSPLSYEGIELPLTMIRSYHRFIQDVVDEQMKDVKFVLEKQKQWGLYSMEDVQRKLQRVPLPQNLNEKFKKRDTILMCGQFVDFAISQLKHEKVILIQTNRYDKQALEGKQLPPQFQIFNLHETLIQTPYPADMMPVMQMIWERILNFHQDHEIFNKHDFPLFLRGRCVESIKLIRILNNLVKNYPIKAILDHTEVEYPGSILSLLARKYNVPFFNVQIHLTNDISIIPSRASHYAIWGKHMTEWLNKRGIPQHQIHEIGSIRLENNKNYIQKNRADLLTYYQIKENPFILTYTTECYSQEINHKIMEWLQTLVSHLPILVLIKTHPSDRFSYEQFLSERIKFTPQEFHLQEILNASDLIATISSTTALEGALLNKGIIVLQPHIPYDHYYNYNGYPYLFAEADIGITIKSCEDFIFQINRLLNDEEYMLRTIKKGQKVVQHMLSPGKEKPSERLARLVKNV